MENVNIFVPKELMPFITELHQRHSIPVDINIREEFKMGKNVDLVYDKEDELFIAWLLKKAKFMYRQEKLSELKKDVEELVVLIQKAQGHD